MLEFWGFIFISVMGTLGHFIYEWSGHNKYAAIIFAVNESTWEHMKLVVFPSLVWLLIEIPFIGTMSNFIVAKFVSLITMLILIPVLFGVYKIFFKGHSLIYSIIEFLISIGVGQYLGYVVLNGEKVASTLNYISLIVMIMIVAYFLIATLIPGKSEIYVDPISNKKGTKGHTHHEHHNH